MEGEKRIISKAQRRKEKKGVEVVTQSQKDAARENTRALRKEMRMLKSNGYRRKVRKLAAEKRERDADDEVETVFKDSDRPRQRRRVEPSATSAVTVNPFPAVNPLSLPQN